MQYDNAYRKTPDFFGTEPTAILRSYCHLIDRSRPVLDIGAGQGRNALFLARQGYQVDAIDPSKVGLKSITDTADKEQLSVTTHLTGFESFTPGSAPFSAILLFGIVQVLSYDDIGLLLRKTYEWCMTGGLVFLTAFTTDDPSYERISTKRKRVSRHSFIGEDGHYLTYLEAGEAKQLFKQYSIIQYKEALGKVHGHGDTPPHQHYRAEAVFRK